MLKLRLAYSSSDYQSVITGTWTVPSDSHNLVHCATAVSFRRRTSSRIMEASQAFERKAFKKSLVQPSIKTQHPERMKPALWDLLYIDSYVPVIFFYKPEPAGRGFSQFSQRVAHLKESLGKVLVHHYPFAGRWIKTYDERVRELVCNDEGVPFFEARIDEDMDTVIGDVDNFLPMPVLGSFGLVGLDNLFFQQDVEFPMPPLFIQVTGFRCGGISVYAGFSHQATDGKGFFSFMADWSKQATEDELRVLPVHDRTLTLNLGDFMGWINESSTAAQPTSEPTSEPEVQVNGVSTVPLESNGNSAKPNGHANGSSHVTNGSEAIPNGQHPSGDEAGEDTSKRPKVDPGAALRFPLQIQLKSKTFLVRKEAVQALKKEAIAENPEEYVTTVDCITAYIWRCLSSLEPQEEFRQSRARSRPIKEDKPVEFRLSTAVDGRKRFHNPALPDQYSPNCLFVFQTPQMTPTELSGMTPLQAAKIFHKTVREISPATWKDFLKQTMDILAVYHDIEFRHLLMTSWLSFPMYDVEFGQGLGKPFFVGVNMEGGFLPEGYCVFLPPRPGSPAAASIQFGIQDDVLQTLLSHKQFLSFVH